LEKPCTLIYYVPEPLYMNAFGWRYREDDVLPLILMLEIVLLKEYCKHYGTYFISSTYNRKPNLVIRFLIILYKDIFQ
jgi:hypothetical protein